MDFFIWWGKWGTNSVKWFSYDHTTGKWSLETSNSDLQISGPALFCEGHYIQGAACPWLTFSYACPLAPARWGSSLLFPFCLTRWTMCLKEREASKQTDSVHSVQILAQVLPSPFIMEYYGSHCSHSRATCNMLRGVWKSILCYKPFSVSLVQRKPLWIRSLPWNLQGLQPGWRWSLQVLLYREVS